MTIKKRRSSRDRDERRYAFVVPPLFRSSLFQFPYGYWPFSLSKMIPHYWIRSVLLFQFSVSIPNECMGLSTQESGWYPVLDVSISSEMVFLFFSSSQAHSSAARRSVLTKSDSLDFCVALYSSCLFQSQTCALLCSCVQSIQAMRGCVKWWLVRKL